MTDTPLQSGVDGYDFLFSATVWWRPLPDHTDRSDGTFPRLAVSAIVSRAAEIVQHEEPGRASVVQHRLEGELGIPDQDRSGRVTVLAADVTLTLAPADRERLRRLNDLRKDEELWEHERQHERNKRRYLGDDVLSSPGSAVVWWLARHENEIEKAVDMIGPLAQIAAAAKDEQVPELFRHLLVPPVGVRSEATVGAPSWDGHGRGADMPDEEEVGVADRLRLLLSAVGLKPDMDGYTVLVHRVVRSLESEGLDEAAEEIRRTLLPMSEDFGAEGPDVGPAGAEEPDGPWSPRTPDPEASPFTGAAAPDGRAGEGHPGRQATSEGDTPPPYFWETPPPPPQEEQGWDGS
ncbi:hypothetical protein ACFWAR_23040 [Streptomyces sp. NPDC059917]|uniref:hypothetical protein n=1 Tax=Streptomyces sp. NPDC059917 TaxID=3347002 RepID=UPI0036663067